MTSLFESTPLAVIEEVIAEAEDAYADWVLTQPPLSTTPRAIFFDEKIIREMEDAIDALYAQRAIVLQGGRVWLDGRQAGQGPI